MPQRLSYGRSSGAHGQAPCRHPPGSLLGSLAAGPLAGGVEKTVSGCWRQTQTTVHALHVWLSLTNSHSPLMTDSLGRAEIPWVACQMKVIFEVLHPSLFVHRRIMFLSANTVAHMTLRTPHPARTNTETVVLRSVAGSGAFAAQCLRRSIPRHRKCH